MTPPQQDLDHGEDPRRRRHADTPLVDELSTYVAREMSSFHTPGHASGGSIPHGMGDLIGDRAFAIDLPSLPETDSLAAPTGAIAQAEVLAADAWGALETRFLVNGSTSGNLAALLSAAARGRKVLVQRSAHRSALSGCILAGLQPVYMHATWDQTSGLVHGMDPESLEYALDADPEIRTVFLTSPTYNGSTSDVRRIARICHLRGVVLIVDAAWGAHLAFHDELPECAIAAGADVVIQSTHKLLGSLTQSSMLHVASTRLDVSRATLSLVQSTSPNYLLMASLDAARRQMVLDGHELLDQALVRAREARAWLREIPGVYVPGPELIGLPGIAGYDETRLTIDCCAVGLSGFRVRDELRTRFGVQIEMAQPGHVLALVTIGTTADDVARLVAGITTIVHEARAGAAFRDIPATRTIGLQPYHRIPAAVMTPRAATFAATCQVPLAHAVGMIAAEVVCAYPPGIPVFVPGEIIEQDAVDYLLDAQALGAVLHGVVGTSTVSVRVVDERV